MPETLHRAPHTNRCEICFPEHGPMYCPNCGRDDWSDDRPILPITPHWAWDLAIGAALVALAWWLA